MISFSSRSSQITWSVLGIALARKSLVFPRVFVLIFFMSGFTHPQPDTLQCFDNVVLKLLEIIDYLSAAGLLTEFLLTLMSLF